MTPADKQKLKDAFNNAVNASPYADEIVEGLRSHAGAAITRRDLVTALLEDDNFYGQVDKLLATGKVTLDQFIGKFEAGMQRSNKGGPKP